jgi:hypothetical protein
VADWTTIASLGTAAGTLILAVATFGSTRSANRAARTAERTLEAGLRPVIVGSRLRDPVQKIMWSDQHWASVGGGRASIEIDEGVAYLAMSIRNVGRGLAVLQGWHVRPGFTEVDFRPEVDEFQQQTRDLYIPPDDIGFWQGAFRDPRDHRLTTLAEAVGRREPVSVWLLYSDHDGGQRTISRFGITPAADEGWVAAVTKHWQIDRS